MYKITKNAIKCKACGDVIESRHVHDFKWCSCRSVAVDGGLEYLKRAGTFGGYMEKSEFDEQKKAKADYRLVVEVKLGGVITTKRGGGTKFRYSAYRGFKPGDLCQVINNVALPLEYPADSAPEVLTVT